MRSGIRYNDGGGGLLKMRESLQGIFKCMFGPCATTVSGEMYDPDSGENNDVQLFSINFSI